MSGSGPVGVGIVGAGVISKQYLENLAGFADVEVLAIGDLLPEAARTRAAEHRVATAGDVASVLAHDGVELVINLTIPIAHAEVAQAAVAAGKHVFNEKPLTLDRDSAQALLTAADAAGLRVGCAPDTFLGEGLQAARRVVERGDIGTPLTALVLMQGPGPESWHPNPAFLFAQGAGPLFDVGPYYWTALSQLFGSVARVAAVGSKAREKRVVGSGPKAGEEFDVAVPSHVSTIAQYESGQSAQGIFSFDSALPRTLLEINGAEATMLVPDPNTFGGDVMIRTREGEDWKVVESTSEKSGRGTGALEMARAIREDRPHRAQGALAYHVLDTMLSIAESIESTHFVEVQSRIDIAELLPDGWDPRAATVGAA